MGVRLEQQDFTRVHKSTSLWRAVAHLGTSRRLAAKTTFIRAGDRVDALYFVEKGEVRMDYLRQDGAEKIMWYIGEGTVLGETPFFLERPCRTSFTTTRDTTLMEFPRACLMATVFPNHSDIVQDLFQTLALKIRVLNEQILTLSLDDVTVQICKYLYLHSFRDACDQLISVPGISRQALANFLGVHRITLYKTLRDLTRQGIISDFQRGKVVILDETAFFDLIAGKNVWFAKPA